MSDSIGDDFQRLTRYRRDGIPGRRGGRPAKPPLYKTYPDSPRVELPTPSPGTAPGLGEVLKRRRSVRNFSPKAATLEELSFLLWASTGISRTEVDFEFRTAPSAGALYPIETYLVANSVEGLRAGVYHYAVRSHELESLRLGDCGEEIALAAMGQSMCAGAAAVFVWTAIFARTTWKYDQRGYRYVYLDAGHVAAHLSLAAASAGLGSCQIGALFDEEVNRVIGVDGADESVVYMSAVGRPL